MTIACPRCGEDFVRNHPLRKFCSKSCADRASFNRRLLKRRAEAVPPEPRPCQKCGIQFTPMRVWQKFCSEACRVRVKNDKRVRVERKRREPQPCALCGTPFVPRNRGTRYCSSICRNRALRALYAQNGAKPRRLKCHHCSGRHVSATCPNRYAEVVKQYGTMGPNREYVPPPGVRVTVRHLPPSVFGEDLKSQVGGRFGR